MTNQPRLDLAAVFNGIRTVALSLHHCQPYGTQPVWAIPSHMIGAWTGGPTKRDSFGRIWPVGLLQSSRHGGDGAHAL